MKVLALTVLILLTTLFPCAAQEQRFNLRGRHVTFKWVFRRLEAETGYTFLYDARAFRNAAPFDIHLEDVTYGTALDSCLASRGVRWHREGLAIVITPGDKKVVHPSADSGSTPATNLEEVMVEPYYSPTRRENPATVYTLDAAQISLPPVNSAQQAMTGKIPGLFIRQLNGVPGSAEQMTLGGRHSIMQGNDPLVVVDGVPMATNNFLDAVGGGSAQGTNGATIFNGIPCQAIGSISVMKDAAATALYGSRASNGVILITLKEGRSGPIRWTVGVDGGVTGIVRTSPLLGTSDFLALREEATRNDSVTVSDSTVPEQKWGTLRHTDYKHMTIGGAGIVRNVDIGAGGGGRLASFLITGRYHEESSVFPGDTHDRDLSLHSNWHRQSANKRLRLGFSGLINGGNTLLPLKDYSQFQYLAPNAPPFTDGTGKPQWQNNGLFFVNIPAQANNSYQGYITTLLGHGQISYEIAHHFFAEGNLGYNGIFTREQTFLLASGQAPAGSSPPGNDTTTAHNDYNSIIMEGMVRYAGGLGPGKLDALAGYTYQPQRTTYLGSQTGSLSGAAHPFAVTNRYQAFFGRLNYVLNKRYILSASLRRDGSTKFGGGYTYGNFWSAGGGWIFRQENDCGECSGLSFGKIKGSFGTTGNDQIVPYDTATATALGKGLRWELNYRAEAGLELGFANNSIWLSVDVWRSWTHDQLIYYPSFAGRSAAHFALQPANVLNEGLEMQLRAQILRWGRFRWTTEMALTLPRNVLKSFPGKDSSSQGSTLVVGKSLSVTKSLHSTGVDPSSGLYTFQGGTPGVFRSGVLMPSPSRDPRCYLGLDNDWHYGNWQLNVFLDWRIGRGANPLALLEAQKAPGKEISGQLSNGPVEWLQRWQYPDEHSLYQRLTAGGNTRANNALLNYTQSDATVTGASFLRVKTLALYYRWPAAALKRWRAVESASLCLRGENLWVVTRYRVTDPETQDPYVLPPVRTVNVGFSICFRNKAGPRSGAGL